MANSWKCIVSGQEYGPLTDQELRNLARGGTLKPTDMVVRDGTRNWVPASKVKGLFDVPVAKVVSEPASREDEHAGSEPSPPPSSWKCIIDGQECGPMSTKQLMELARSDELKPTDMVARDGARNWMPAGKVKGLFGSALASSQKSQLTRPTTVAAEPSTQEAAAAPPLPSQPRGAKIGARAGSRWSRIVANYRNTPSEQRSQALGCLGCLGIIIIIVLVSVVGWLWSFAASGPGAYSYKAIDDMKGDFDRVYIASSLKPPCYVAVNGNRASLYILINASGGRVSNYYSKTLGWDEYDKLTDQILCSIQLGVVETRGLSVDFDGKKVVVSYEEFFDANGMVRNAKWKPKQSTYVLNEKDRQ